MVDTVVRKKQTMALPYYGQLKKLNKQKRFIKFLAISREPNANGKIIKGAPSSVIKTICNAAENVLHGNVLLTPKQREVFKKHKKLILKLRTRKIPIKKKRELILQDGGAFWIPLLLSAALSALGPLLFQRP